MSVCYWKGVTLSGNTTMSQVSVTGRSDGTEWLSSPGQNKHLAPCLPALLRTQMWRLGCLARTQTLKVFPGTLAPKSLLWQSVGVSTYCFITFKTWSKHVVSVLTSRLCPVPRPSLQALKMSGSKLVRLTRAPETCLRHFLFSCGASPPPDVFCSLHVVDVLWRRGEWGGHAVGNSPSDGK